MLPDLTAPDTCPTCNAAKSHDVRQFDTLALLGRVFKCGAALNTNAAGAWFNALACPKSTEIIAQLRADNARLGAMNVTLAAELQAIADTAEGALGVWASAQIPYLPEDLHKLRTVYDLAVEALEGQPSAAVSEKVTA